MEVFVGVIGIGVTEEVTVLVGVMGGMVAVLVGGDVDGKVILGAWMVSVGGPLDGVTSDPV
jgi:hypothetical protein